jgi:ribonuclease P protein component
MTPKRAAKRAVTRNAIKRQIYTVSTDLNFQAPPMAYVVRLSAGFDKAQFISASSSALKAAVRQELYQLFAKTGALPASAGAA